jgi:hypothetical protein
MIDIVSVFNFIIMLLGFSILSVIVSIIVFLFFPNVFGKLNEYQNQILDLNKDKSKKKDKGSK